MVILRRQFMKLSSGTVMAQGLPMFTVQGVFTW